MADLKGCFSHESDEWETPKDFYEQINEEFSFNLDPCATEANHKCELYYTAEEDGLSKNWGGGGECFVIHLIHKLRNGLKSVMRKDTKKIPLLHY